MTEEGQKRCPFDKNHCIREICMVWDDQEKTCAFALIPQLVHGISRDRPKPVTKRDQPSSSGLSGRFADPLFG